MSACGYSVVTGGAVALSAATAKSVLGVKAHANSGLQWLAFALSFDGATANKVSALVELCYSTWATNGPGTNSTSVTPAQRYGRALTAGFTAAKTWTAEPTALTVLGELLVPQQNGTFAYQFPLGQYPDCALAEGFVLRLTSPDVVNVRAEMLVERI